MDTVKLYTIEGSLPRTKGSGRERVLAMPVSEDGESFMAYNGRCSGKSEKAA